MRHRDNGNMISALTIEDQIRELFDETFLAGRLLVKRKPIGLRWILRNAS